MNFHINRLYIFALIAVISISSCKRDDSTEPAVTYKKGKVNMHFDNVVGTQDLVLSSQSYTNGSGQAYQVTRFNYYISNIVFHKDDGSAYAEQESYHLVQEESGSSQTFTVNDVEGGVYKAVTFLIGVDSLRNVSGAQTGALDPVHGMFWSWNTGYIMMKLEGDAPASPSSGKFLYHAGGFSGANSVLKTVTLTFPEALTINANNLNVHVKADISRILDGPETIDFSGLHTVHMPGVNARKIADNYAHMFRLHEVTIQQ